MSASIRRAAVSALAIAVVGCAGRYGVRPVEPPRPAAGGIEAAALPYEIVDGRTGRSIDEAAFWGRLAGSHAVCVGEEHPNPHHHWMQLHVVRELIKRLPRGTRLALAMEMFQRPFQGVLDDYAARRIDDAALRTRSGYQERWGYEYKFYGPTIDAAVGAGAQLLAANAAKELTKKVVRHGLESLTTDERAQVPELKLDDPAHRSWFDALMEDMGGSAAHSRSKATSSDADKTTPSADQAQATPSTDKAMPTTHKARTTPGAEKAKAAPGAEKAKAAPGAEKAKATPGTDETKPPSASEPDRTRKPATGNDGAQEMPSADRVYAVQVIWDETMADTGARWLAAHPGGHVVLLAGDGHCHDSAIVARMKRRGVADAISIRGVIDDGEGNVGEALARPINDYVIVLHMPPGVERKTGGAKHGASPN